MLDFCRGISELDLFVVVDDFGSVRLRFKPSTRHGDSDEDLSRKLQNLPYIYCMEIYGRMCAIIHYIIEPAELFVQTVQAIYLLWTVGLFWDTIGLLVHIYLHTVFIYPLLVGASLIILLCVSL